MALFENCTASWKLSDLADATGRGNTLTNNNSATFSTGKIGNAAYFNGTNQSLSIADNPDVRGGSGDFTIAFWFYIDTLAGASISLVTKDIDTPANSRDFTVDMLASGTPRFYVNGGGTILAQWGASVSSGVWHCCVAWHDSTNDLIGISIDDGTPVTDATGGVAPEVSAAPFMIGARAYAGFEDFFNGRVDNVNIIHRLWNSVERSEFYNGGNGVEYIAPPTREGGRPGARLLTSGRLTAGASLQWQDGVYFPLEAPAGAGAYTLTADTGVFTETGTAAGLRATRQLAAASASFTQTGISTGLRLGRKLSASSASFTETGIAVSLRAARTLPTVAGTFTLTGTDAGLRRSLMLSAASAAFTFTGNAAILLKTGGYTLIASGASFTLTGAAAALRAARSLAANSGTFTETGSSVGLRVARKLSATTGAFTLNGTAAGLSTGRKLNAVSAAFTQAGQAANLKADRRITVSSGSFVFTGTAADLIFDAGLDEGPQRSASLSVVQKPTATITVMGFSAVVTLEPKPAASLIVEDLTALLSVVPKPGATLTKW